MNKIIIIEDDRDAWFLMRALLIQIGYKAEQLIHFETIAEFDAAEIEEVELVLTNLDLPDSIGTETFAHVYGKFPSAPIIVITGNEEDEMGLRMIKRGAQDFLSKGEIDKKMLRKSIQYAIERKRGDNDYKKLFQHSPVAMYIFDSTDNHRMLAVNDAAISQYGYSRHEFLGMTAFDMRPKEYTEAFLAHVRKSGNVRYYDAGQWVHRKKDGTPFYVHVYAHKVDFDGQPARMVIALDVDSKVRSEHELDMKIQEIKHIMESMTDAFFTINSDHVFTYVNKQFEKVLRRDREDILGRNIWSAFPEAVELKFYEGYHRAIRENVSVFFEEYLPGLDLWLSVKAYPVNGGLAVYFIDMTEQKKTQELLLNEERKMRAIINNTSDIIWSMDRNYNVISANNAFWARIARKTGKTPDEVTTADIDTREFEQWIRFFDRAFSGETFKMIWEEMFNYEMNYAEVSFNPIWNETGEVVGASCFSRDITAEKKMQEKIIANDINLKGMIDNTEDLIWSVDNDMKLIAANQSFLRIVRNMTGKIQTTGSNVMDDSFGKSVLDAWREQYGRALKGERFRIERKIEFEGQTRYTETRFNPILSLNREVVGVSCFSRDITDMKNYLHQIETQNEQLREIAWLQSHKVRNHVATILGLSELINTDDPLDENNKKVLTGIIQSSVKLDAVIAEINEKTSLIDAE